jgi:hypothetical protein
MIGIWTVLCFYPYSIEICVVTNIKVDDINFKIEKQDIEIRVIKGTI